VHRGGARLQPEIEILGADLGDVFAVLLTTCVADQDVESAIDDGITSTNCLEMPGLRSFPVKAGVNAPVALADC
jgi:hypothetical protein